ncbi:MAG: hypothetical protein IKO06_01120 [Alphaproteobacteria bacterium]|nr:hypothetical protein [Alphaproteobacteria bacterium]
MKNYFNKSYALALLAVAVPTIAMCGLVCEFSDFFFSLLVGVGIGVVFQNAKSSMDRAALSESRLAVFMKYSWYFGLFTLVPTFLARSVVYWPFSLVGWYVLAMIIIAALVMIIGLVITLTHKPE